MCSENTSEIEECSKFIYCHSTVAGSLSIYISYLYLSQDIKASLILLKNQGVTEAGNEIVTETWTDQRLKPVHLLSVPELGTETIP